MKLELFRRPHKTGGRFSRDPATLAVQAVMLQLSAIVRRDYESSAGRVLRRGIFRIECSMFLELSVFELNVLPVAPQLLNLLDDVFRREIANPHFPPRSPRHLLARRIDTRPLRICRIPSCRLQAGRRSPTAFASRVFVSGKSGKADSLLTRQQPLFRPFRATEIAHPVPGAALRGGAASLCPG